MGRSRSALAALTRIRYDRARASSSGFAQALRADARVAAVGASRAVSSTIRRDPSSPSSAAIVFSASNNEGRLTAAATAVEALTRRKNERLLSGFGSTVSALRGCWLSSIGRFALFRAIKTPLMRSVEIERLRI